MSAGHGQDRPGLEGAWQRHPLSGADMEVLRRVAGMAKGEPRYAGLADPAVRTVIGAGAQPQQEALTGQERTGLGTFIQAVLEEWFRPRLLREPDPAWELSGADVARLGLIWRSVAPPPEDPERPLLVNADDPALPPGIPDGWVIATSAQLIAGPASALAWQGEDLGHGLYFAAWPAADDDEAYWDGTGAREVQVTSNLEIAAQAGRYLADCGLLPGEGGLTATEVASRLLTPWKEGALDDDQVTEAALSAILERRRDDEDKAYDFSDGPQRRALTEAERAFLFRVAGEAAADPRWADEQIARHPGTRAALGDGTRPQARPLTARERDDISRMIHALSTEYRYDRPAPGYQPPSSWTAYLTGGDIARLVLIDRAVTPRHGTPDQDGPVLANAAKWTPPEPVPDGWVTVCAPVPLSGPMTWRGPDLGNGTFYAAGPNDDGDAYLMWLAECEGTREVKTVTNDDIEAGCYAFLGRYGCAAPEQAGTTIAGLARDLGYPFTAAGAQAADAAATATYVLRGSRANGDVAWYAIHGAGRAGFLPGLAAQDGYQVAPGGKIPFAGAPSGAKEMADVALSCGWDLIYTNEKGKAGDESERELMALNSDTGEHVSRLWDARGRMVRDGGLGKITASPRPLYMPAAGRPAPELLDPVGCAFPEDPAAIPRRGGRAARTGSRATGARRAPRP